MRPQRSLWARPAAGDTDVSGGNAVHRQHRARARRHIEGPLHRPGVVPAAVRLMQDTSAGTTVIVTRTVLTSSGGVGALHPT